MNEEEFVKAAINAVSEFTENILDLSIESVEKRECFIKANELAYWLAVYQKLCLGINEEGEEEE